MSPGRPRRSAGLLLTGDFAAALISVSLALLVRLHGQKDILEISGVAVLIFALASISTLYIFDAYTIAGLPPARLIARIIWANLSAALLTGSAFYLLPEHEYGRGLFVLASGFNAVLTYGLRRIYMAKPQMFSEGVPTLILGHGPEAEVIRKLLNAAGPNSPYRLISSHVAQPHATAAHGTSLQSGAATAAAPALDPHAPELGEAKCIVVCEPPSDPAAGNYLTRLRLSGCRLCDPLDFYMDVAEEIPVELLSDNWLWFVDGFDLSSKRSMRNLKRLTDLVLAGSGAVLSIPIVLVTAILIKLEDGGPILYCQTRTGLMGEPFTLFKFRSMRQGAEAGGPQWAAPSDSRVTRIGRLIRTLRIDEIPQMWNVLRGEMSFIGPRPERPEFVAQLAGEIPFYHLRHYVCPGITGWAQVCYPYGASVADTRRKLQFDLYYILHASPVFDLRIILKTVQVILFRRGSR